MKLLVLSCTHAKQTTKVKKNPARTFSAQQELIIVPDLRSKTDSDTHQNHKAMLLN
jgi:predicted phosphodiesterase